MKLTASIDDASASDIRFSDLMHRYEIETTFYWPVEWYSLAYDNGYEPLDFQDARDIARNHEIGSHTITHRHLTKLPFPEACMEIAYSKQMLENLFSTRIRKFCPPRGYTTPELTEFTMEFYDSQRLTKGDNLVHIHPDSGGNNNKPWRERFKELEAAGKDIEIWCHGWELDKYNLWQELEGFLYERQYS